MFSVHTTPGEFQKRRFHSETIQMFSVHTTPGEFQKRRFHSETIQMFYVHTAEGICKITVITGQYEFVFEENSVREST